MNVIKDHTRDDDTTFRGFEILELLRGTAGDDSDIECSALVAVTVMYFLGMMDIPITQRRVTILCERIANLMDDFSEEYANAQ